MSTPRHEDSSSEEEPQLSVQDKDNQTDKEDPLEIEILEPEGDDEGLIVACNTCFDKGAADDEE
jgi:hypothetical protein